MLLYPCVCIHILCVTELLYMSTALKAYISDVFLVATLFLHSNLPCVTPVFSGNQRQIRLSLDFEAKKLTHDSGKLRRMKDCDKIGDTQFKSLLRREQFLMTDCNKIVDN